MTSSKARGRPGRPKGDEPPKKATSVYIRQASIDWLNENLPRGVSISSFVDEAVTEKIRKLRRR